MTIPKTTMTLGMRRIAANRSSRVRARQLIRRGPPTGPPGAAVSAVLAIPTRGWASGVGVRIEEVSGAVERVLDARLAEQSVLNLDLELRRAGVVVGDLWAEDHVHKLRLRDVDQVLARLLDHRRVGVGGGPDRQRNRGVLILLRRIGDELDERPGLGGVLGRAGDLHRLSTVAARRLASRARWRVQDHALARDLALARVVRGRALEGPV